MSIFKTLMQKYKIKRNGRIINEECYGNYGKNGKSITFDYGSDIQKGDVILDTHGSFVITSIKTYEGSQFPKYMWHHEADVVPEDEYNNVQNATNTFNLRECTINGAIQNSGKININNGIGISDIKKMIEENGQEDKERLNQLIEELQKAENFEIYKKGMLCKFSDLIVKHSWLSGAIANYIVPMLFNKIV